MRIRLALLAPLALLACSTAARATPMPDPTTYYYTGGDFASISGIPGLTTSDKLFGSVTLNNPLADNFSGQVYSTAFSFTAGPLTIVGTAGSLVLTTDANGNIATWLVNAIGNSGPAQFLVTLTPGGGMLRDRSAPGSASSAGGSWSKVAPVIPSTPEPGSITLFGTGLLSVAGIVRKRFVKA